MAWIFSDQLHATYGQTRVEHAHAHCCNTLSRQVCRKQQTNADDPLQAEFGGDSPLLLVHDPRKENRGINVDIKEQRIDAVKT